jgi:hypothetical protein
VTIEPKTISLTFKAVGQTQGSREVEVRARVGRILLRRFYTEGAFVKQGTLLFKIDPVKIDPAPYQAALNRLKGGLEQEEARLEKARGPVSATLGHENGAVRKADLPCNVLSGRRAARGGYEYTERASLSHPAWGNGMEFKRPAHRNHGSSAH